MNTLSTLLIVLLISLGFFALVPLFTISLGLLIAAGACLIWFLPILLIAGSDETTGGEKIAWILAIIFLSWFAWVFYFFIAPLKPKKQSYSSYYHYE